MKTLGGRRAGEHTAEVMDRAWDTLGGFIRTQSLVALIDAVIIGTGLAILGVPLAIPLAGADDDGIDEGDQRLSADEPAQRVPRAIHDLGGVLTRAATAERLHPGQELVTRPSRPRTSASGRGRG